MAKTRHFHAHETKRYDALDGLPLASFRRRSYAILIDVMIVLILSLPFGHLRTLAKHMEHSSGWEHLLGELLHEIESLVESVVYFAVTLKVGKGQTPGKYLMKIRVLSLTHHDIGWWQAIERGLAYGASLLEGGFGFFQYFLNRNRQTVHDRIAETIVVDVRKGAHRLRHHAKHREAVISSVSVAVMPEPFSIAPPPPPPPPPLG
jgi:uncharacterized RDD family membrane protein YckC